MEADPRSPERDAAVLGVVVHGPAIVARSTGIAMAVRCVLACPTGLELDLVLRAVGVQAEAAARQTFGVHPATRRDADIEQGGCWGSEPDVVIEADGRRVVVDPHAQSSSGGQDEFTSELRVGLSGLPSAGMITVVASWPQAGLAEGRVTLALGSLDDLEDRIVRLPS